MRKASYCCSSVMVLPPDHETPPRPAKQRAGDRSGSDCAYPRVKVPRYAPLKFRKKCFKRKPGIETRCRTPVDFQRNLDITAEMPGPCLTSLPSHVRTSRQPAADLGAFSGRGASCREAPSCREAVNVLRRSLRPANTHSADGAGRTACPASRPIPRRLLRPSLIPGYSWALGSTITRGGSQPTMAV